MLYNYSDQKFKIVLTQSLQLLVQTMILGLTIWVIKHEFRLEAVARKMRETIEKRVT